MRLQRCRNFSPSAVSARCRVLRWNSRTPSRVSMRATLLPTADDDRPSSRPVAEKLPLSATCTNMAIPPKLSIRSPFTTFVSDMLISLAHFSSMTGAPYSLPLLSYPTPMPSSSPLSLPLQVLAACLTGLLIPLCFTGPAVALPALGAELHGSAAALNWVINAYILSYGSAMMVAGSLTDVLGRRRVWLAGLALFCVATLAIAHAPSVAWIAALRFVQGLGGAAAFAAAMSSLAPMFHGAARSRVMSVLGTTFGLGLAFGPLAPGAMLALARWPAIFYATAALGAMGMLLVWGSVPADPPRCACCPWACCWCPNTAGAAGPYCCPSPRPCCYFLFLSRSNAGWRNPCSIYRCSASAALSPCKCWPPRPPSCSSC